MDGSAPSRRPLVGVEELRTALAGPEESRPVLLDVRYRLGGPPGRSEYERAHLPGAAFVDLDTALAEIRPDGTGGRHPMPDLAAFTAAMRAAGVRTDRPVVAYDDWCGLPASRAWWLLRYYGKDDVQVLDGGLAAWAGAGLPTESGPVQPPPGDLTPTPGRRRLIDAEGADRYAARGALLDARPAARFRGENETVDPVAGHIPGARSVPALETVDRDGRFPPERELVARLRAAGVEPGTDVGVYCGSGVQATHLALVLAVAGVTDDAAVYVGSWSDWITDASRPVEV